MFLSAYCLVSIRQGCYGTFGASLTLRVFSLAKKAKEPKKQTVPEKQMLKHCSYAIKLPNEQGKHKDENGNRCNYFCPFIPEADGNECETPVLVSLASIRQIGGPIYHPHLDEPEKGYDTPEQHCLNRPSGYICQRHGQTEAELKTWLEKILEEEAEDE